MRRWKNLCIALAFLLSLVIQPAKAQPGTESNPYILFTGLVLTSDSLQAIPYVQIRSVKRGLIGYSDLNGYFDVVVRKGDTIEFTQVEKVNSWHVVPDTLTGKRYNVIKLMTQDTIYIPAIFIRALPPKALFAHEFVHSNIQADAYERARQNLEMEAAKDALKLHPADAHAAQTMLAQNRANQLYYYNQAPPQNYLSPTAWMQFLEAWKRGDYKKKVPRQGSYISPY